MCSLMLPGRGRLRFSTDEFGFRHTQFEGRDLGLADIEDYERIGLVLGSSHLFGFALAGNSETLPSQLSQIFGYPFFGIAYPEADTRTLHATLLRLLRQFAKPTRQVLLITGGDFTRYCYGETADPLFGPPMLPVDPRLRQAADAQTQFANLLHFTSLWTEACAELAAQAGASFCIADDVTFFEKSAADPTETACELGQARGVMQEKRFSSHRRHGETFARERRLLAEAKGLKLVSYRRARRSPLHRRVSLSRREPDPHRPASRQANWVMRREALRVWRPGACPARRARRQSR